MTTIKSRTNRNSDPKDGGFLSRKLLFGLVTLGSLAIMHLLSARWGSLIPGLETLDGAAVAIYAIYCGANVGNKLSIKSILKPSSPGEPEPPSEQSPG